MANDALVEEKQFELRLAIESQMYELFEWGFTIDQLREFVLSALDDIQEQEDE